VREMALRWSSQCSCNSKTFTFSTTRTVLGRFMKIHTLDSNAKISHAPAATARHLENIKNIKNMAYVANTKGA